MSYAKEAQLEVLGKVFCREGLAGCVADMEHANVASGDRKKRSVDSASTSVEELEVKRHAFTDQLLIGMRDRFVRFRYKNCAHARQMLPDRHSRPSRHRIQRIRGVIPHLIQPDRTSRRSSHFVTIS